MKIPIISRRRQHKAALRRAMGDFTWPGRENGDPVPRRVTCQRCGDALESQDRWVLYLQWHSHATTHAYESMAPVTRR